MAARICCLFVLISGLFSYAAAPELFVSRTGTLFFAASDLTTNGVIGLSNAIAVVSQVPARSTKGGTIALVNTQVWARFYGGPRNYDQALRVALDSAGHVIVCGYSDSGPEGFDILTIKYSSIGTALWTNRYDGPAHGDDYGRQLAVDRGGNVYVAGDSEYTPGNGAAADGAVVKYSPAGAPLWTNRFDSFGTNRINLALAVDGASNVFVAVGINPYVGFQVVKLDMFGMPLWTNLFRESGSGDFYISAMALDATDSLLVTGYGNMTGTVGDYFTLKYSNAGVPLWTNRYHRTSGDQPAALVVDAAGRAIVTGDASYDFYATVAYGSDGQPLWTNLLAHPTYSGGNVPRIAADALGNIFVTGGSAEANGTDADFTTVKIATNGLAQWTNRFVQLNVGNPFLGDTTADAAGNFYMTGHSTAAETGWDFFTVKYAADGTPLWTNRFNGSLNLGDLPQAMAVDNHGHVYVCGETAVLGGVWNYATVKYAEYIHYRPPANFVGTDTFQFVATDSSGLSVTNEVAIRVQAESLWFNPLQSILRVGGNEPPRLHLDGVRTNATVILYATLDFASWTPIATNTSVTGAVAFPISPNGLRQFYRAAQTMP